MHGDDAVDAGAAPAAYQQILVVEGGQVALDGATLAHRPPALPDGVVVVDDDDCDPVSEPDVEAVVAVGEEPDDVPLPDEVLPGVGVTAPVTPAPVVVEALEPADDDWDGVAGASCSAGPAEPPVTERSRPPRRPPCGSAG